MSENVRRNGWARHCYAIIISVHCFKRGIVGSETFLLVRIYDGLDGLLQ